MSNNLNDISKIYLDQIANINKKDIDKDVERWTQKEQVGAKSLVMTGQYMKPAIQQLKQKKKVKESFSNWRNDLREVMDEPVTDKQDLKKVDVKTGIKNKVIINPKLTEAIAEMGGELLEVTEVQDDEGSKEDPQLKQKSQRQKQLKKQVLMRKLTAVRQGAGEDIVAHHEPEGELVEGVVELVKKGAKRHSKAIHAKKVKDKKAVPYEALAAEYDPLEDAIDYFYEEGINEEGIDQLIEEIGLDEFVDFIDGSMMELNEERAARKASVRAKSYAQVKKEVDASDAAKKKAKKGEYAPSYAKKETDVTVYDDKPAAKKKAVVKKPVAKKAAPKPAPKKAAPKPVAVKKPVTKKVVKAVAKVKKTQPAKKTTKQGLGDKIRTAYKKGMERHKKAREAGRVPEKRAKEFGKGVASGVKTAVKFAKDVKKVVSEEELLEKDLNAAERRALPDKDFVFPGKGEGPKGKQRGAYPIPDKKHARNALAMAAAHASPEKQAKVKAAVKKKFPGIQVSESRDKALDIVRQRIIKKHGEGAIYDPKRDKPTEADKKKAAAERKKRDADKAKAFADRAKKAGYKSTQDYANVVARYGSEDNMRKGKGLGS